jgi:hypothetical protein
MMGGLSGVAPFPRREVVVYIAMVINTGQTSKFRLKFLQCVVNLKFL